MIPKLVSGIKNLSLKIHISPILTVNQVIYLGVDRNSILSNVPYINKVVNRANGAFRPLYPVKIFCCKQLIRSLILLDLIGFDFLDRLCLQDRQILRHCTGMFKSG